MIPKLEKIKKLLWEEWDPIAVREFEDSAFDEYDSYAIHLFSMLNRGASVHELSEYLFISETKNMGLAPSASHEEIARKAKHIFEGEQ